MPKITTNAMVIQTKIGSSFLALNRRRLIIDSVLVSLSSCGISTEGAGSPGFVG